jgi:hypothetical protein
MYKKIHHSIRRQIHYAMRCTQGVTRRCRLSLLTNSALEFRVQMRGEGGNCGVSAYECSSAHHVICSPNKLWRPSSIFNLNVVERKFCRMEIGVRSKFDVIFCGNKMYISCFLLCAVRKVHRTFLSEKVCVSSCSIFT